MKIELQVERNGWLALVAIFFMGCMLSSYYIYRETEIRRLLVERVKAGVDPNGGYGSGALQGVNDTAARLKAKSGGIRGNRVE